MSLKLYLQKLSEIVYAETSIIRTSFNNSTNKGTGFEVVLRNLIATYTPATNFVTHGEIIDTFSNQSGQVDIAVVQDFHPRGHKDGRPNILLYDLVTIIGEAKTFLDTTQLETTITNSENFLEFKRHSENNNMLSGGFYNKGDEQKTPPYFLIALSTNISYTTLAERISNSNVAMAICLEHTTTNAGLIVLGKTHENADVTTYLDNLGSLNDGVWETDNPLLALIWGMNNFYVPLMNLTNVMPHYLK